MICYDVTELVRRRGVSPCGVSFEVVSDPDLSEVVKVSLLTSLNAGSPVFFSMRHGRQANRQFDFLDFLVDCVQQGQLLPGDTLVLDNASIHHADDILVPLHMLMQAAQVRVCFLPTYSPELNPCELVFAQCKKYLRYHRRMQYPFWYEIVKGFAETTANHMYNYYYQCIWNT